jgi:copper/silver efflux system protein
MFFAAFLGVTLVPVLMVLLIRGKITPEIKNPVNRFLIWAYQPLANFVLRYRLFTLACAVLLLAFTIFPFKRLGSEFMPPLNEGTLLYMPTAIPGMSIAEAAKILQIQDRQLKNIPEAVTVFGKAGQADTPTDPAQRNDLGQAARGAERQYQDAWHGEHFLDADPDAHRNAHDRVP